MPSRNITPHLKPQVSQKVIPLMSSHSMDLDGPRESGSMSMDVDDGAVSCHHPHRRDSVKMNSPSPSGGRMASDFHSQKHQIVDSVQSSTSSTPSHPPPGRERLSGSDDSPQLMIPPSPSPPVGHLGEMGDINQNHGRARQRRRILPRLDTSVREVTSRKRKHTHDSPHTHIMDHDHTQDNDANSQPHRRVRPRLWAQQDRGFSPLLYMSPRQERDLPVEEETISAFNYPPNATDQSHSIQRYFLLANPRETDPRTSQSSSSPKVNDLEDPEDRKRSDSTNSLAEVALASVVPPKHGRLSTLQGFSLPRPFEETERPSMPVGIVKVHERGLEAGPSFLSTDGRRTGGLKGPSPTDTLGDPIREYDVHACSSPFAMLPLEPGSTTYFDKPICDSPDSIEY